MNDLLGMVRSCWSALPHPISSYCQNNLDTIPKVMNHALLFLAGCNLMLLLNSLSISITTFFASFLLLVQTASVILVMNHDKISFAPRTMAPSEFMVGMCLGLCIGGVILSFFLSVTFRRAFAFCKYASEHYEATDHEHACPGNLMHRCWSLWWWSSLVFWLDLLTAVLIAAGRPEISYSSNQQSQYQSIDSTSSVSSDSAPLNNAPPSFQQQQPQQQHHGSSFPTASESLGGYADFAQPNNGGGGVSTAHVIGV